MQNCQVAPGAVLGLKSAKLSARRALSFGDRCPVAPRILATTIDLPSSPQAAPSAPPDICPEGLDAVYAPILAVTNTKGTAAVRLADIAYPLSFDATVFAEPVLLTAAEEACQRAARPVARLRLDPVPERCSPAAAPWVRYPARPSARFHRRARCWRRSRRGYERAGQQ
jgi:hypothetical protein